MKLKNNLGEQNIKEVIEAHPEIGEILERHEIGCIKCSVGTCLLKDVVTVHYLGEESEKEIEKEINLFLENI